MHLHLKVNLRKIMTQLVRKQAKHAVALMVSRLRTKRPEKTFSLSIVDCFYFSGSSLKPGARFLATCSSTALVSSDVICA